MQQKQFEQRKSARIQQKNVTGDDWPVEARHLFINALKSDCI